MDRYFVYLSLKISLLLFMKYIVKSRVKANGVQYNVGDNFPSTLKKVDYKGLLDSQIIESIAEPKPVKQKTEFEVKTIKQNLKTTVKEK